MEPTRFDFNKLLSMLKPLFTIETPLKKRNTLTVSTHLLIGTA